MELTLTNDADEVRGLMAAGWCPVECSIGGESLVDSLVMDHHGPRSDLECVAIRAYRDHFGVRRADRRFVGVGTADADMSFAIAALSGMLPHPDAAVPSGGLAEVWTRDWSDLAALIGRMDTDPIGLDLTQVAQGPLLMLWHALVGQATDSLRGAAAVHAWTSLLTAPPDRLAPLLTATLEVERQRIAQAREDLDERGLELDGVLLVMGARGWGFDVWYGRDEGLGGDVAAAWQHPVVMRWDGGDGAVTLGCPNKAVAEAIFGAGGLLTVFPALEPNGWGGREAVGGSPRGLQMTEAMVMAAARRVAELCGSCRP